MKGYYEVESNFENDLSLKYKLASRKCLRCRHNLLSKKDEVFFDLQFHLARHIKEFEDIPECQQELYADIEEVSNVLNSLQHTDIFTKRRYFDKLLSLSRAGLTGKTAQPGLAKKSLSKLKEEVTLSEGQRIKSSYMARLGIFALILLILSFVSWTALSDLFENLYSLRMYLIVWSGSIVGTWISFGARKFSIEFKQLGALEEDRMNIYIRTVYVGVCSLVFVLLLNSDIINIDIGTISSKQISEEVELQAILGVLCGLIESKLGVNIYNKAKTIIGKE